jgi:hypothetical protein
MILEARQETSHEVVGESACISKLAAIVAAHFNRVLIPRIMVFRVTRTDRWWDCDRERDLARLLLREHDTLTEPMRDRARGEAIWTSNNIRDDMNRDTLVDRVALSFGEERLGDRINSYLWDCYLSAKKC